VELAPEELPGRLEAALALGRNSWPLAAIRRLGDRMLEAAEGRKRSAAHEARWLNLTGFFLRPGFGFPGDDLRLEQARRIYAFGLQFPSSVENETQWWIFWGRVAGGLNRNQQTDVYQRISSFLLPRGSKKPPRINSSLLREMWRTASSLELLPIATKTELGDALLKRVRSGDFRESELWCLSRLGARQLFYGPINQVVPPSTAGRWVDALLNVEQASEAMASIARQTGNSTLDLAPGAVESVRKRIEKRANAEKLLAIVNGDEERDLQSMGRVFGEELPSGLVFAGANE
jgi:hypothetical protein